MIPCAGTPCAHSHQTLMLLIYLRLVPFPLFLLDITRTRFLSPSLSVSKSHAPCPVQPTAAAAAAPGTASFSSSRSTKTQSLQDKTNARNAWRAEKRRADKPSSFGKRASLEKRQKRNSSNKQINPARKRRCSSPRVRASGSRSERGPGALIQYCRSAALQAIRFLGAYSAPLLNPSLLV